jgi:hypothetical protein
VFRADNKLFYDYKKIYQIKAYKREATIDLDVDVTVVGDCRYMFFDADAVGKDDKMFWCWINTAFVQGGVATFTKNELDDAVKDTKCSNFNKEFKVEFFFRPAAADKIAAAFDDSVRFCVLFSLVVFMCDCMHPSICLGAGC